MFNILAWAKERFPFVNVFSAYLIYVLVAAISGHIQHKPWAFSVLDIMLGLALVCHFLVLRIIDEHKDFAQDTKIHPERVLQQGRVTLKQLRIMGVISFAVSFFITLIFARSPGAALWAWLLVMTWSVLMTFEFFCSQWLRKKLFLYSVSHMLVLPLMIIWAGTLSISNFYFLSAEYCWLLGFIFVNGLIYEVVRKSKGAEEELTGEETFTKKWGARNSALAAFLLVTISFSFFAHILFWYFNASGAYYFLPALLLILSGATLLKFTQEPRAINRKKNEGIMALYVLAVYVTLVILSVMDKAVI